MKEVTVGMTFQNRANKRIGQVTAIDEAGKSATITYNEVSDGQSKEAKATVASLIGQKSWKYLHDVAGDGTPMNQVMQEILSDEQLAAKKKLEEMLAPANATIEEAKARAKSKVKVEVAEAAEAEAKAKAEKEAEEAEAKAEKAAEAEENELLARYQKDIKAKKQKKSVQAEAVDVKEDKKQAEPKKAEKKQAEKAEKPKKTTEKKQADKPKKERKKKEKNPDVDKIVDYICKYTLKLGGEVGVPRSEDMMFRALRKNGKQFCKLVWSGKSAKLATKSKIDSYESRVINYQLPLLYEFVAFDDTVKKAITEVLTTSYKECADKKSKKTKTKKEEK